MSAIGNFIFRRMTELDLKPRHVAVACDVSEAAVRNWISGGYRPRDDKFRALARVLKVTKAELEEASR